MSSADRAPFDEHARRGASLPHWFWAAFSIATLGVVLTPVLMVIASPPIGVWALLTPATVAVMVLSRWWRGIDRWHGDPRARRTIVGMLRAAMVADFVALFVAENGNTLVAELVLIAATIVVAGLASRADRSRSLATSSSPN